MAAASCPEPGWHTAETRPLIPEALKKADHVFVSHGARRTPLDRPYDGPFRVTKKEEKFFVLKVGPKEQTVSVDRLKPAFGFADSAPAISVPKGGGTTVLKTKKTLNPTAEVFVPATRPKESSPTVTRSRFGRVSPPPERLGN